MDFWGFKDVGLPRKEMEKLLSTMKKAGKKTFLEVVTYSPEAWHGRSKNMPSVWALIIDGNHFLPRGLGIPARQTHCVPAVCRTVSGSPCVLEGPVDEISSKAFLCCNWALQVLICWPTGIAPAIRKHWSRICGQGSRTQLIAGSIDTPERMRFVESQNVWPLPWAPRFLIKNLFLKAASGKT